MKIDLGSKVLTNSKPWGTPGRVVKVEGDRVTVAWPDAGVKLHDAQTLVGAANRPSRPHGKKGHS